MRPAAKSMSVSAGWLGVCTEGCQLSPCRIVYIIVILDSVSLAVCLWCYGDCQIIFWVITVGLLWRRQSLCRVIYVMYIFGGSPLRHFSFVDVLLGGGVPDDRRV